MDESGCFTGVINHNIAEGQPAYYAKHYLKLQGRKVVCTEVGQGGEAAFKTGMSGKPDLMRELRASLPGLWDGDWRKQDKVKCTDFDEATGRVIVAINTSPGRRGDDIPYARRLPRGSTYLWCGTLSHRYLVTAAKLGQRTFLGASLRCRRVSGAAPEVYTPFNV